MAKYRAIIEKGILKPTRPDLPRRWIKRHEGSVSRSRLEENTGENPKSSKQIGYYHALLKPELHDEMWKADEPGARQQKTIKVLTYEVEVPYTEDDTHEVLLAVCGRVGKDGKALRFGEMNMAQARKFIDNLLDLAMHLGMNLKALKARRPSED